ncbi:hypothetical protein ACOZ35_14890 [Halorubrum xinjiangense]|uniref:hypothetical protein n=1 Tax=Halorubrum xinjiangense TaxID=261291 RepID=UPI003C6F563F
MTGATFRLGKLRTENGELPSPEELADGIQDDFTVRSEEEDPDTGETVEYAEKGRNVFLGDGYDEYNFCFFTYVADTLESFRIRDGNDIEDDSQIVLETAWVIYFDNGQFAYQSRQDIPRAWIPRFIKKRAGVEVTDNDFVMDSIGQDEIENWYDRADRISKAKFSQVSEGESDLSGAGEKLQELARVADGLSFSTGRGDDGDLREATLIDEASDSLEIASLNVKIGDENMITIKQSGRVEISWNESDWDQDSLPRNRGQTVRTKLRPYLESIRDSRSGD